MSVKSISADKGERVKRPVYPCLRISEKSGNVVLFEREGYGVVVDKGGSTYSVGYYSNDWDMDVFLDYGGSITLENE